MFRAREREISSDFSVSIIFRRLGVSGSVETKIFDGEFHGFLTHQILFRSQAYINSGLKRNKIGKVNKNKLLDTQAERLRERINNARLV